MSARSRRRRRGRGWRLAILAAGAVAVGGLPAKETLPASSARMGQRRTSADSGARDHGDAGASAPDGGGGVPDAGPGGSADARAGATDGNAPVSGHAGAEAAPPSGATGGALPVPVSAARHRSGARRGVGAWRPPPITGAVVMVDGTIAGETDSVGQFRLGRRAGQPQPGGLGPRQRPCRAGDRGRSRRLVRHLAAVAWRGRLRNRGGCQAARRRHSRQWRGGAHHPRYPRATRFASSSRCLACRKSSGHSLSMRSAAPIPATPASSSTACACRRCIHFALGPSIVHPYLRRQAHLLSGGYPARLGGYVSGAVVAETVSPPSDVTPPLRRRTGLRRGRHWPLPVGMKARGTVAVAARYSYTGLIALAPVFWGVKFGYADYQLRVDHALAGGQVTLFALGSFDSLDITDSPTDGQGRSNTVGDGALQFHRLDLRWQRAARAGPPARARPPSRIDDASSQLCDELPSPSAPTGSAPRRGRTAAAAGARRPGPRSRAPKRGVAALSTRTRRPCHAQPDRSAISLGSRDAVDRCASTCAASPSWRAPRRRSPGVRLRHATRSEGVTRGVFEPRLDARLGALAAVSRSTPRSGRFSQMPSLPLAVRGLRRLRAWPLWSPDLDAGQAGGFDGRLPGGAS